jgi:hypothetical protein
LKYSCCTSITIVKINSLIICRSEISIVVNEPIFLSRDTEPAAPVTFRISTLLKPAAIVFADVGPVFKGSKAFETARVSVPSPPSNTS